MPVILSPFHLDERLRGGWPLDAATVLDPSLPDAAPWERMAVIARGIADAVAAERARGAVPLVLSGDCVAALAVVAGVQRVGDDPVVVWLDAHGDVQSPETSASGYLGGMPIRQLLGGADRTVPEALGLRPLDEGDVVLLDGRDLDPPEAAFLAASRVRHEPLHAAEADRPVVLHVADLPGLLFPVGGGPSLERVVEVVTAIVARNDVVAVSLACTTADRASAGVRAIAEVARGALERSR
ncbi:arginase family protein [Agrococcus jenensis]|uniref:Arginase n=1 Tax=Agrococcus jenensis TaxID=46353 RepID=A0A3N2AWD5_9MICO|nr:arginase family protein [Agrococcus jenensis]ROR67341.1 arginase [Agrococcus jenensis]